MYKSKLSDTKWLILGIFCDLGWILFFFGLIKYLASGADGLGSVAISALFLLTALCAVLILIGIIELISQRIRKLQRVIKKSQLTAGYGFVVFGSLAAFLLTLSSVVLDFLFHYEAGSCLLAQIEMCLGALMCFSFGLPILRSFKKR